MIQIHKALIAHTSIIADFQVRMARETENLNLDKAIVTQGVKAVFQDDSKGIYFIATDSDKTIGSMLITKEWSDWRNSWVNWLQSVYVIPEMRKQGVFRLMFNYLSDLINQDSDVAGIRLYVDASNKNALQVYTQLGMNGDHYKVFEIMKELKI